MVYSCLGLYPKSVEAVLTEETKLEVREDV